jgi:hypothetical protein
VPTVPVPVPVSTTSLAVKVAGLIASEKTAVKFIKFTAVGSACPTA